jgi:drug/metabolite transporter (DMT)-like permease
MMYTMWSTAIVFGTMHTTQSHAYTLTNLHAFIFLVIVLAFKKTITRDEKIIVLTIFVGMSLMVFDPWSYRVDTITEKNGHRYKQSTMMVDIILILSNLLTACFFMFNKMLMRENSLKYFILLNFAVMLSVCIIAVVVEGARLDSHPKHGLFGWMNAKNAFQNIFLNGLIATLIG